MQEITADRLKYAQDGIGKAQEAFATVNELIIGVMETRNAPMVNHFLVKLRFAVNDICDVYFEGFDPEAKALIEEHVKSTFPERMRDRL